MKSYLDMTSKYLKAQKKRAVLTVIGIILSTALITGIGTLFNSWWVSLINNVKWSSGDYFAEYKEVGADKTQNIINHIGVSDYSIKSGFGSALISQDKYFDVEAYSKSAFKMFSTELKEGSLPQNKDEIAIDYYALDNLPSGTKFGDIITLKMGEKTQDEGSDTVSFTEKEQKKYKLVGLLNPRFIADRNNARAITFINENLESINNYNVYIKLSPIKDIHKRAEQIAQDAGITSIDGKPAVEFNENLLSYYAQSADADSNNAMLIVIGIILLLVVVATVAVIYNAFNISVVERISQFGLLRCVGATSSQTSRIVIKEAMLLGIIGIPIGIACGTFAMGIVFKIIAIIAPENGFDLLNLIISPEIILGSAVLGLATVYLSALLPAFRASRVSPMEAVNNAREIRTEKIKRVAKARLVNKLFGSSAWLAVKNISRNRKRFYITTFSMVISIVLFIVFGSFVDFAYSSGFADKSENPNYTIRNTKLGYFEDFSKDEINTLRNTQGVSNIYSFSSIGCNIALKPEMVNSKLYSIMNSNMEKNSAGSAIINNNIFECYGDDNFNVFKDYLLKGDTDLTKYENGVIIVNSGMLYDVDKKKSVIMDITQLDIGDEFEINIDDTHKQTVKVAGILKQDIFGGARNRNGGIKIIAAENMFKTLAGEKAYPQSIMIQMQDKADRLFIKSEIESLKAKNPDFEYVDYDELAKNFNKEWLVLSIFLYGFIAVITLIGALNIINTISTNIIIRTKELSLLRAVGMSMASIKKLVCFESVLYGAAALAFGSILGCLLSYLMFRGVVNVREFEWVMPVSKIIISGVGAVVIALLAGYIPLRRISNEVIIEGIRAEE